MNIKSLYFSVTGFLYTLFMLASTAHSAEMLSQEDALTLCAKLMKSYQEDAANSGTFSTYHRHARSYHVREHIETSGNVNTLISRLMMHYQSLEIKSELSLRLEKCLLALAGENIKDDKARAKDLNDPVFAHLIKKFQSRGIKVWNSNTSEFVYFQQTLLPSLIKISERELSWFDNAVTLDDFRKVDRTPFQDTVEAIAQYSNEFPNLVEHIHKLIGLDLERKKEFLNLYRALRNSVRQGVMIESEEVNDLLLKKFPNNYTEASEIYQALKDIFTKRKHSKQTEKSFAPQGDFNASILLGSGFLTTSIIPSSFNDTSAVHLPLVDKKTEKLMPPVVSKNIIELLQNEAFLAYRQINMLDNNGRVPLVRPGKEEGDWLSERSIGDLTCESELMDPAKESDGYQDVSPGMVSLCYNFESGQSLIMVAFHGTRSGEILGGNYGWSTNFDDATIETVGVNGRLMHFHGGFFKKYESIKNNLYVLVEKHLRTAKNYGLNPQIFVTGHSQGGAMATLATFDLARQYNPNTGLFDGKFKDNRLNARTNFVLGYLIGPGVVSKDNATLAEINATVGKANMVSHFGKDDIVPKLRPGSKSQSLKGILNIDNSQPLNLPGYHIVEESDILVKRATKITAAWLDIEPHAVKFGAEAKYVGIAHFATEHGSQTKNPKLQEVQFDPEMMAKPDDSNFKLSNPIFGVWKF